MRLKLTAAAFTIFANLAACSGTGPTSPYAGEQSPAIKALSAKEVDDLRAGAGMGYAKAAELNGYPGPMHVLELSSRLGLSAGQQAAVEKILREHKAEARALGSDVVSLEQQLDAAFAREGATAAEVDGLTRSVADAAGRLRASHLKAHIETARVLTREQVASYVVLRGYSAHRGH